MKRLVLLAMATIGLLPMPAFAHRLDEYLQATILSINGDVVSGTMRLVPGVAVATAVMRGIDTNSDGRFSQGEQRTYAERVLHDVSLTADGQRLAVQFVSVSFPAVKEMEQGVGEIQLAFDARLPAGDPPRTVVFENHHEPGRSVYLVNCLVPADKTLQIAGQVRNLNQSVYQLTLAQGTATMRRASLSGFGGAFRLGARHIAEGTDHLLFLLTLLLPAPLLASRGRWRERATTSRSLMQILRIVTAFTVGHSLTLALSAFGGLRLPSGLVEVLIAVSILVSAIHAMKPIFPGREAAIAGFFGLIHGLAFAAALSELGFGLWYRMVSVLGFNLGIEAIQLAVVAATLPSLLLLSRTLVYRVFRMGGAAFAAVAATGWILERGFRVHNGVGALVERGAHEAPWMAGVLLVCSGVCWLGQRLSHDSTGDLQTNV